MAASTPTEETFAEKVPELREAFTKKYGDKINDGETYDVRDIERFKEDDRYAMCFNRSFWSGDDGNIEGVADKVNEIFIFRKSIKVNDLTEESFPAELKEEYALHWKGEDKEGKKIMIFGVSRHKKGTMTEEMKQLIAYNLEKHHKELPGDPDRVVVIFDFTNAGISNMDLEVVKFLISALSTYFPGFLKHILLFEMPWLLSSVWKLIQSWLSKEQKEKIHQVKKADMSKYIEASQLESHMLA